MNFTQWFKEHGIRRNSHITAPLIFTNQELVFPFNSNILWLLPVENINYPDANIDYFQKARRKYLYHIDEYIGNTLGNPKPRGANKSTIIKDIKKKNKGFIYAIKDKEVRLNKSTMLVVSSGIVDNLYKYDASRFSSYYKALNNINTSVEACNSMIKDDNSRPTFFRIKAPNKLWSSTVIIEHAKDLKSKTLELFIDGYDIALLELYKFMYEETHESSAFAKISPENRENFIIMLNYADKNVFVKLSDLYTLVKGKDKDLDYDTAMEKVSANKCILSLSALIYLLIKNTDKTKEVNNTASNILDTIDEEIATEETYKEEEIVEEEDTDELVSEELSTDEETLINEWMNASVESALNDDSPDYNSIEDINVESNTELVIKKIEKMEESGTLTKNQSKNIRNILQSQLDEKSPYPKDNRKLTEVLKYTEEDFTLSKEDVTLPDNPMVADKNMLIDTTGAKRKKYIERTLNKDILNVIYDLQVGGNFISNYKVEEIETPIGKSTVHSFDIYDTDGIKSPISFPIPHINEDGSYVISDNEYMMRDQKSDLPIRKLNYNTVKLDTYYGKINILLAEKNTDNLSRWFSRQLRLLKGNMDEGRTGIKNVIFKNGLRHDGNTGRWYNAIGKNIATIIMNDGAKLNFKHNKRDTISKDYMQLEKEKGKDFILLGKKKKTFIFYRAKDNTIHHGKDELNLFSYLGISEDDIPREHSVVKVFKREINTGIVLSYYLGFTKLLNFLKVKHERLPTKGYDKSLYPSTDYVIVKFKDLHYAVSIENYEHELIFAGLSKLNKILSNFEMSKLENRLEFRDILTQMDLTSNYIVELELLEDYFVGSISRQKLKSMKEPVRFIPLVIRANQLLTDKNYKHPRNELELAYKGYERIAGIIYHNMINSIRVKNNTNLRFSKTKVKLAPYEIWGMLSSDSTTMPVANNNPIAGLKQFEEYTTMGHGGIPKEAMVKSTRALHETSIGTISGATKDSAQVGITGYYTSSPNFTDVRGMVNESDMNNMSACNIMDTTSMLMPFADKDDAKRQNFSSIQMGHVVAIDGSEPPALRTGMESVIPMKVGDKDSVIATQPGIVTKIRKSSIQVDYKDGTSKKYKLGVWTSKEEAGYAYRHKIVTNLDIGDKFRAGDAICYNNKFFCPDFFDKKKIVLKVGMFARIGFVESDDSHEDSLVITSDLLKPLSVDKHKIQSIKLFKDLDVTNMLLPGSKVKHGDTLFTFVSSAVSEYATSDIVEDLENLSRNNPKVKSSGEIERVQINYNFDLETASKGMQDLIRNSKTEDRRVTSEYSIEGNPLLEDSLEIKVYIRAKDSAKVGDKFMLGNQLKTVVGNILNNDNNDYVDSSGRKYDGIFSQLSDEARKVPGFRLQGTTLELIDLIKIRAIQRYEGKL